MAAATFDVKSELGALNQPQHSRQREINIRVDFTKINPGTGLAAGESAAVGIIPAGFVYMGHTPILRTAEGAAGNFDFGTEADPDGFLDGGNANGTPNANIAEAGTETIAVGTYFHTDTEVRVSIAAAQPTLDAAVADLVLTGFMLPTS